jgi:hypothetical protein
MHDGEHLPPLTDESEPLGPGRDESGLRCVHRSVAETLVLTECFSGSGASGSTFAIWARFVIALGVPSAALSTDFFDASAVWTAAACALLPRDWAAARPGLSADLD